MGRAHCTTCGIEKLEGQRTILCLGALIAHLGDEGRGIALTDEARERGADAEFARCLYRAALDMMIQRTAVGVEDEAPAGELLRGIEAPADLSLAIGL